MRHGTSAAAAQTHVGDAQRGKVVPLAKLGSSHALSRARARTATQGGRHVGPLLAGARSAGRGLVAHTRGHVGRAVLAHRRHRVLVRTPGRKVLAVADTALDLLVLELVLHRLRVGVLALVLGVLAPVDAGAEDDVLAHRRRVGRRADRVLCTLAKLAPRLAVGHAGVDRLRVRDIADPARRLHLLALVIVAECDDGLGAVLVGDGLGGREVGRCLLDIIVVGPVVPGFGGGVSTWASCAREGAGNGAAYLGLGGAVVAMLAALVSRL